MTDAAAVASCQHETPVSSRGTVAAKLRVNTMCCYGCLSLLSPKSSSYEVLGGGAGGCLICHHLGSNLGCVGSVEWRVIRKGGKKE